MMEGRWNGRVMSSISLGVLVGVAGVDLARGRVGGWATSSLVEESSLVSVGGGRETGMGAGCGWVGWGEVGWG